MLSDQIQFQHLRLVETAAQLNSLRRTANERNVTQPAVTRAIRNFESLVGVRLFERTIKGSFVTPEGRVVAERIRRFRKFLLQGLEAGLRADASCRAETLSNRVTRSQVKALISVRKFGNVEAAARSLNITPRALLKSIHLLGRNSDTEYLIKGRNGPILTEEGEEFAKYLQLAVAEIDSIEQDLSTNNVSSSGTIHIGVMPSCSCRILAQALNHFTQKYPKITVKIKTANSAELLNSLSNGDLDLVYGQTSDQACDHLEHLPLWRPTLHVVVRQRHPLTFAGKLELSDLIGYSWVISDPEGLHQGFLKKITGGLKLPSIPVETNAPNLIGEILSGSDMLSFMTDQELSSQARHLVPLDLKFVENGPPVGIFKRRSWKPNKVQNSFMLIVSSILGGKSIKIFA